VAAPSARGTLTYSEAGVDLPLKREALAQLLGRVRYRPPPSHGRPVPLAGHYAGLVKIGRETLALTTDTVGTKVILAEQLGLWEPIGQDLVAANVNDLAAVGARPAGLVDVISCRRPDAAVFRQIGTGMARGLRLAQCALLGGETATVPDLVRNFDVGGTALGFFPRGRSPVTGQRIQPGDVVLGVPSTGFQTNGFTLIRRLLLEHQVDLHSRRSGSPLPLGIELLRGSRIYVPASEALASHAGTTGFAHITGGGVRNLTRLHPKVAFVLNQWPDPEGIFRWLADLGGIPDEELYQTFNMGIGFVIVLRPRAVEAARRALARAGVPDAVPVGYVERGVGVHLPKHGLRYDEYD
jgi:phosphoribosylformylglycinamidine cyclo-ligase